MSPLLSVCVPTYNRAALLSEALAAVLGQITPDMADRVEVVVLDNASPDDTPGVVARAQAQFPHAPLRHVRRPQNVGPDANFCDAPRQARGEFVYLLSDDDVLLPGAIETLLTLIEEYPGLDGFFLNVRPFWESPQEQTPPLRDLGEDRLLPNRDDALRLLRTHVTFVSCIAFRRSHVAGNDYAGRYHTNLAQAYMFLDALAPGRGLYAVRQPYLAQRIDNAGGFDVFRVLVTNFHALMVYAQSIGYSPQAVRQVLDEHLRELYNCVLLFKTKGSGTLAPRYGDGVVRLLKAYGWNRFLLLLLIPRMLVPRAVFVPVQRFYLTLKQHLRKPSVPSNPSSQKVQ